MLSISTIPFVKAGLAPKVSGTIFRYRRPGADGVALAVSHQYSMNTMVPSLLMSPKILRRDAEDPFAVVDGTTPAAKPPDTWTGSFASCALVIAGRVNWLPLMAAMALVSALSPVSI